MNTINDQRDNAIDIIKGLGIIFMVAGHCGSPISKFVYLFHMAIFFISSGYCYKETYSNDFVSLKKYINRKIKSLWFPYVFWTAIYSCLHNLFIKVNIYTDNLRALEYIENEKISITEYWNILDVLKNILKACFFQGKGTQLGGAFWFIATLMVLSIMYCMIDMVLKKVLKNSNILKVQCGISIVFLLLGYSCYLFEFSFAGIDKVLSYYILFYIGVMIKKSGFLKKNRKNYEHLICFTLSFAVLLICNQLGRINLDINSYENPFFFFCTSLMGWFFCNELANLLNKNKIISKLLVYFGQNTMSIVIFHFLCFKIVNYFGVLILDDPVCLVAAFPILYTGGLWWLLYMIVGLGIPLLINFVWKRLKGNIIIHKAKA